MIFHSFFQHQNPVELDIELKRIRENPAAGKILESRSHEVRSQFNLHNIAPALIKNLVTTELIEIASSILGGEPLIYQSHLNFKSPFRGEAYDWHSDYVYWKHHDGMLEPRAISIVFPLSSHSIENGGLEV
ncbi:MAG: phytanoyl-CoA dioxygenase family protein, partial [Bdellovibrionales bacterium]|nr:phytanoyl-CoA dioxygenase family protein [Bdellovibrionales bacterium]